MYSEKYKILRKGLIEVHTRVNWCTQERGSQFPKLMSQPATAAAVLNKFLTKLQYIETPLFISIIRLVKR